MLIRTWNVFHGNAVPPERRAFLAEMVRLASADDPDVLCLQEVPAWALPRLGDWSGMRALGLHRQVRLAWAKERRVCHAVRIEAGGRFVTVANLHASSVRDRRCQDAELLRAAVFAEAFAEPDDVLVLAGDFNTVIGESTTLDQLATPSWGFSEPIRGLDQILVRGAPASRPERWPEERRRVDGRLLSDHAPIETRIG